MRLVNVVFAAAVMMCMLAGVAALAGTAAAQEQSTRQTLQTREVTNPGPAPENTSQAPEQSAGDAQENTACPGAELIRSVGPTDRDLVIGPFTISGESFRLTYETTDADQSGLPFFDVTVLNEAGNEVGGQVIRDEGIVREIVRSSPGRFTIEARAEDLKYKLTAEDCTGRNPGPNPPSGDQPVPTDPIPRDQYRSDVDPPNEDEVIDGTISDEPLPNTGGVPLLGVGFFSFICIYGAFALLRPVIRRDS